ncbi:hypothetical protein HJA82_02010 [Rhizobium bangladeshense]|uniref:hypothetical protein n=1 Tax=Rhizobium bangladeshense TaxID=1138189 RepID=UPI001C82A5AB|nr:hypothetical protein [Rhizobium bangladeshense]MBX4906160.1 hypothetical protein [Rhizobium bangladeshense]
MVSDVDYLNPSFGNEAVGHQAKITLVAHIQVNEREAILRKWERLHDPMNH